MTARSLLKESPKDVKRLEVLKPTSALSMKERYEASVSKENRLEAATQPILSEKAKQKALAEAETNTPMKKDISNKNKKRTTTSDNTNNKKKKAKMTVEETTDEPDKMKDEVTEGIDWSDEEVSEDESENGSSGESDSE